MFNSLNFGIPFGLALFFASAARPILMACSLLAALALSVGSAHSAPTDQDAKAAQLGKLRQRIEALRVELEGVQDSRRGIRGDLASIERKISHAARRMRQTKQALKSNGVQLQALQHRKDELDVRIAQQRELLARHMRAAYVAGRQDYLKMVLNQEQPAAVGRTLTYYNYLHQARRAQIDAIQSRKNEADELAQHIEQKNRVLETLQATLAQETAELATMERERRVVLSKLDAEYHDKNAQLTRMQIDETRLSELLQRLQKEMSAILPEAGMRKSFKEQRGRLPWPIAGAIVTRYGAPRAAGKLIWQGVVLQARQGEEVRAISDGRVAYADWLQGFGMVIIIDHGEGYMSLYAYNQSLAKEVGDWTEVGEVVATVGSSGNQRNSGLYFEIRHNGQTTNPAQWCKKH